jgi:hypothetical protein
VTARPAARLPQKPPGSPVLAFGPRKSTDQSVDAENQEIEHRLEFIKEAAHPRQFPFGMKLSRGMPHA